MSKLNVLIVGASVAGPVSAYWFARLGATVTVIERFPSLRSSGQSIDIRTVGVSVMRKMPGMEAAVRAKTTQLEGMSWVRENGRPYGIITPTGNPDQQSLVSEYEIFRGDLAKILFDITKDNENIKYVFGEQVASMQQQHHEHNKEDGPITVEFMNGFPTSDYDLVVACDGATSRTRALGLGCGARDYLDPTNCWASYFTVERDLLQGSKIGQAHSAPGGRFMAVGPDPSGANRVTLMGISPRNDSKAMSVHLFREAMKQGDDALKIFVAEHYKGAGWKIGEIVKAMMDSTDFYASEIVQVKLPNLSKGRFVLVGDAGYAPGITGAGTTLAIAGAYVLAGEIGSHKGDLAAGLQSYEQRMRPIVDDLQKVPSIFPGVLAPQSVWGIWLRDHIFAFIAWTRILEFSQKFFAGAFSNTDKYEFPHYKHMS
ncbi:oxidoreductase [Phlyctema vagabunda]|uniref:Oxidoreductase n=1 Tax=Phlyctema vagabunda TaxID=108571 RepID=A0ABR4P1R6_9HELO